MFCLVFMFYLCSWNIRGLNNLNKKSLVKSVVAKFKRSVLYFQESKVEEVSCSFLQSFASLFFLINVSLLKLRERRVA